ncbi:MAG: hypothetical protein LBV44_09655, partial [Methylobacillus sp.]|nr:hypothetical protein [Methylobacillus sp.]
PNRNQQPVALQIIDLRQLFNHTLHRLTFILFPFKEETYKGWGEGADKYSVRPECVEGWMQL